MADFAIRFSKAEVPIWAKRYAYADDTEIEEIGERSRLAGCYTRQDFLTVCEWKTRGRPRRHYQQNSEEEVRRLTAIALTTSDEKKRITTLLELHGVSWPVASVLLHLAHRDPYPILDFRALWSLQCERTYYSFSFWWDYVQACRALAAQCGVSMRDLDRALWQYSNENQRRWNMTEESKVSELTRREILAAVQRLCRSFGRNMAYYRAGWTPEARLLFEQNPINGNFWNTVNGNFLDMCVLEWCKLFGGGNEKHSWIRIAKDPDVFKIDLLQHLGLDEGAFKENIRIFREYRDKWVAHQDRERKGLYPRLETASKAVWFYYGHICNEQIDQEIGPKTIEIGYKECEQEASMVYRQAFDTLKSSARRPTL